MGKLEGIEFYNYFESSITTEKTTRNLSNLKNIKFIAYHDCWTFNVLAIYSIQLIWVSINTTQIISIMYKKKANANTSPYILTQLPNILRFTYIPARLDADDEHAVKLLIVHLMLNQSFVADISLVHPTFRAVLEEQAGLHLMHALVRCQTSMNTLMTIKLVCHD